MNYSNRSQQPRSTPIIRAGLSVQELKAMTAMRMAQTGERQEVKLHLNPATSYQTANPQQLQAAGITPVVINDRSRGLRGFRQNSLSSPSQGEDSAHSSRRQLTQLSPYHQQILPFRRSDQDTVVQRETPEKNSQWDRSEDPEVFVDSLSKFPGSASFRSHLTPSRIFDNPSSETKTPRSPNESFLPAINASPRYYGGPEVRSPPLGSARPIPSDRVVYPDEESEYYSLDTFPSTAVPFLSQHGSPASHFDGMPAVARRPTLNRSSSTPVIAIENTPLPSTGSSLAGSNGISQIYLSSNLELENGRTLSSLEINESPVSSGKIPEKNHFPFKKSKTAPKLGIISPTGLSPIESPVMKLPSRKNSVNLSPLRDRVPIDLASEVAEAVLDTPSNTSTPLVRSKYLLSLHPDLHPQLRAPGYSLQPINLSSEARPNNQLEEEDQGRGTERDRAVFDSPRFLNGSCDDVF